MEEQLLAFAAKALNISQEEVKETLANEENGGLETLLQKDATRIKETKDAGYKSAERKVNTTWEQRLKEKFSLQSDAKGTELIDIALEEVESKTAAAKPTEITETMLKKHPLYLSLEKQAQEIATAKDQEWQQKLAEKEEAFQQKELLQGVKSRAKSILDSLKPILSTDPKKAETQVNELFLSKLERVRYQPEGDSFLLINTETGERLENAQGHAIKFEDYVKELASSAFDFQAVEQRSSSARNTDEQSTRLVAVPKNKAEYIKLLSDDSIPAEDKMKAVEAYESAN
jgi:hypothetical protein